MNDKSKVIDVEKSSLLSLKAELLRKQEEAFKHKKEVPKKVEKVTKLKSSLKSGDEKSKESKSGVKIVEYEDSSLIAKSQKILEAKAKYYEKMVKSRGSLNSDENCLVMFNKKERPRDSDEEDQDEL